MDRALAALFLLALSFSPAAASEQECFADDSLLRSEPAAVVAACVALAEQGDARAQNRLGVMHAEGWLTLKDSTAAVAWYRRAAAQGNVAAEANLAFMLAWGNGVPQDYGEAYIWATLAEAAGSQRAADLLRMVLGHLGVRTLAEAQMRFGALYADGRALPRDETKAAIWYRYAALDGLAAAQSELARRYLDGLGVAQDARQAYFWASLASYAGWRDAPALRRAAAGRLTETEIAAAKNEVGVVFEEGRLEPLVPTDYGRALALFHEAASAGNARAQINLGWAYRYGRGVPADLVRAYFWYGMASRAAPSERLRGTLTDIASQLSPRQVEAAAMLMEAASQ
ncbi:MAG: tetratricopeptide repeat protein [Dongiaceae bacterium]